MENTQIISQQQCNKFHSSQSQNEENPQNQHQPQQLQSQQQQSSSIPHSINTTSNQQLITCPHSYLSYCQSNKKIKIMTQQNPIFPSIFLKDISLHYKGPMQDKAYSKNYQYYLNIRRGNTLLQMFNQKQEEINLFFCKRGMKKFFDLEKEYLEINMIDKLKRQNKRERNRIFQYIDNIDFNDNGNNLINNANSKTNVHLYSVFKQNGEHCQITYVKQINCWLFGSKNVSIIIRDQSDLQKYYLQKIRFYWSRLIAKQFLQMIKPLSPVQLQQLKHQLSNKTLLGQHCGSSQHQHITKYKKVQIIFYSIVQNNPSQPYHCLPVSYIQQFCIKFNFKMSKTKQVTNLTTKNQIYKEIYSLLKQTAQGTMQQYGQGSVLYVVQENNHKQQKVISMCKLKTCEYLIFRRLREMLKLNVAKKSTANTFEKFKFDIKNKIQTYFKPPKKLEFYYQVARQAFKQAAKNEEVSQNYLRYKFVDFLQKVSMNQKIIEDKVNKNNNLKMNKKILVICLPRFSNKLQKYAKSHLIPLQYMFRAHSTSQQPFLPSIHILHMLPRLPQIFQPSSYQLFIYHYSQIQLQTLTNQLIQSKDYTKSHLITFIKNQQKQKTLKILLQKIKVFQEVLKKKGIKINVIDQNIDDKDEQVIRIIENMRNNHEQIMINNNNDDNVTNGNKNQNQSSQTTHQTNKANNNTKNNKLILIYPLLLPGTGKTNLFSSLKSKLIDLSIPLKSIDSDMIRKSHMQKNLSSKHQQLKLQQKQYNQVFYSVKQDVLNQYKEQLKRIIQQNKENEVMVVIIDKVFGPEVIEKEIKLINQYKNVIPLILLPPYHQYQPLQLKHQTFPFNLQYILIALKRCIQRESHLTMPSLPQQICNIFLWYLKFYSSNNFSFKRLQQILVSLNKQCNFMKIQTILTDKNNLTNIFLKKKFQQAIQTMNKNKMIQLIQQMYKNQEYLKDKYVQEDNSDKVIEKILEKIKKLIE